MKNRIITIGIALLMAAGYSSCKKDDTKPANVNQSASTNPITSGKWVVAKYEMNGVEHTEFYEKYRFVFQSSGTINIEGSQATGKWSMNMVNNQESMQLDFGTTDPFNLLNSQNWKIISKSATKIEMEGKRGDDGTHALTLQKL